MQSRWNKNQLMAFIDSHIISYPTPFNLNYMWSFGSAAGICLVIQMVTGIFLAMYYTANADLAFSSIEHIMRNVHNGWLIRYIHANGASMFFIVVYCHIFRGLYYVSYIEPRRMLWCSGVIIFLLMMATAFMGYVLPWGQMSFWGVTVITSLFTAIPYVGQSIVEWIWGGYVVTNITLIRFYSLHYLMPFVIAGLTLLHLALLHQEGSNNPLGVDASVDNIPFYPYFYVKDLFTFFILVTVFSGFVFYWPNYLGHPDNYIPADSIKTPAHIVPEWYFLPFYAILRSIPHKVGGVVAMFASILVLLLIPFTNTSETRSSEFRPFYNTVFWLIFLSFFYLAWLGTESTEDPFPFVGLIVTFFYFFCFIFLVPFSGIFEKFLARYKHTNTHIRF